MGFMSCESVGSFNAWPNMQGLSLKSNQQELASASASVAGAKLRVPEVDVHRSSAPNAKNIQEQLDALLPVMGALVMKLNTMLEHKSAPSSKPINSVLISPALTKPVGQAPLALSESTKAYSAFSTKKVGEKPDDVYRGVKFSDYKNEPVLSSIKAAMERFGQSPLSVYASVTRSGKGYDIVMRDGVKVSITLGEIAKAKLLCGFQYESGRENGKMFKDVVFMYAASAKRVQLERREDKLLTYDEALKVLVSHPGAYESLKRLGIIEYVRSSTAQELVETGAIGVVEHGGNTNFAREGLLDGCNRTKRMPSASDCRSVYRLV